MFTYLLFLTAEPENICCGAYSSWDAAVAALVGSDVDETERDFYEVWEVKVDQAVAFYIETVPWGPIERREVELAGHPSVVHLRRWDDAHAEDARDA